MIDILLRLNLKGIWVNLNICHSVSSYISVKAVGSADPEIMVLTVIIFPVYHFPYFLNMALPLHL